MSNKRLKDEVYNKEAMLVGMLWSDPEIYSQYSPEQLSVKTMGNKNWSFYLGLGRYMYEKGVSLFDDITVSNYVAELRMNEQYDQHGGYETIEELMGESASIVNNIDSYYNEVKKYALLREYYPLFGDKVLAKTEKYDYLKLSKEQISAYWNDKIASIDIKHNDTQVKGFDLLSGLDDLITKMNDEPDIGLPLHRASKTTSIINGWAFGTVTIAGAFSGNGKTSYTMATLIMSCIENDEKLLIIANEQDLEQYQKLLLITVMGNELYEKLSSKFPKGQIKFDRKSINKGFFSEDELLKLKYAVEWIKDKISDKESLIKLVPLESYTMENVKKTIKYYHRRGYARVIVDTAKPTEGGNKERWVQFVDDFDELYKLARKNGGGLNLAIWATIQLSDSYVGKYWLNETAIGDGKKIKNVVDTTFFMRMAHPSEYKDGSREVSIATWKPLEDDGFNDENSDFGDSKDFEIVDFGDKKMLKKNVHLEVGKNYAMLFCGKNRRGQSNLTGLDVLVYEVDFNSNRWKEIGFTGNVYRDDI